MTERGAAGVTLLAVAAVVVALATVLADVGLLFAARLRAAAAADAAALAAAPVTFAAFGTRGSPGAAAAAIATANGAQLVECRCPVDPSWSPRRVEVVVSAGADLLVLGRVRVTATSRADFDPRRVIDGGGSQLGETAQAGAHELAGAHLVERLVEVAALR